jgi:hypothetical protein
MGDTKRLRQAICTKLPDDIQISIWKCFYSSHVLEELLTCTMKKNQKYEKVYVECYSVISSVVDLSIWIRTHHNPLWDMAMAFIEDDILEANNTHEMYVLFQKIKNNIEHRQQMVNELNLAYNKTSFELKFKKRYLKQLHRMLQRYV